jgi:hypothetical protein
MAEGVGFEPTVALRLRLISSQVPLTTQPPFHGTLSFSKVATRHAPQQSKKMGAIRPFLG